MEGVDVVVDGVEVVLDGHVEEIANYNDGDVGDSV